MDRRLTFACGRTRGGENETFCAVFPGGFEHVQRADDICFHVQPGVFHGRGYAGIGSQVDDYVRVLCGVEAGYRVADIANGQMDQ